MNMLWEDDEMAALSQRYGVKPGIRLHAAAEDYHFPEKAFLREGYAPPGGYVKDFGVVHADGFRAAYAVSEDPLHFEPESIREFRFVTDAPGAVPSPELPVDKPTPLSLELVARGEGVWLVAYFRWHIDRNRLFFGALDWSSSPATITEIGSEAQLRQVLREVGMQGVGEPSVTGSDGGYPHHPCGNAATITKETLT